MNGLLACKASKSGAALGDLRFEISDSKSAGAEPLRSPGQLPKHYSPKARLIMLSWRDEADLTSHLTPRDGSCHRADDAGAEWIVVEALPDGPEWRAIADRLARAAG